MFTDTIVARSSGEANGAVGMIRLSGENAFAIADKVLKPRNAGSESFYPEPRRVYLGDILDNTGRRIDETVYVRYASPKSYTGDDMVEIFCHGNLVLIDLAIEQFIRHGARMALPGEFTRRAFINGKIDLTQAESVQELIAAESEQQVKIAAEMLSGSFSDKVRQLREKLLLVIGWSEASIDFPEEEDATAHQHSELLERIELVINGVASLIDSYEEGKLIRNGIRVVIAGETNAGKSSLMNALFEQEKSIVTPIHGTTRDVVEGTLTMRGVKVVFSDTAGIRTAKDIVEQEGIKRTLNAIKHADIVLYLLDASKNCIIRDKKIWDSLSHTSSLYVINKIDLVPPEKIPWLNEMPEDRLFISAKDSVGIGEIKAFINQFIAEHLKKTQRAGYAVNQRHFQSLKAGYKSLCAGRDAVRKNESEECFVIYFKEAADSFAEILGEITADDVLNKIFAEFCIGK